MGGGEKKVFPFCSFRGCGLPDSCHFLFPTYCREGKDLTRCSKSALILLRTTKVWKDSSLLVFLMNLGRESKSEPFNYVHFYIWMSSSCLLYTGRMPGEFRHNTTFQPIFKRCLSLLDILITRTAKKPSPIDVVCLRMGVSPHFTQHRAKPYFSEFSLDSCILARCNTVG